MDANPYAKSDPTILLLNEIDILLAQTHLMELYLKQAQATAANDAARAHQEHQTELARLRADLAEKEQSAVNHAELVSQQQILADQINELEAARREIAGLRDEMSQLELAGQRAQAAALEGETYRQHLQSELSALRVQIEENRQQFQQRQLSGEEIESSLRRQLAKLQGELSDTQNWSRNTADELDQARMAIAELHDRLAALQASRQQAEADAAAELEENRARLEAEIAKLHGQLEQEKNDAELGRNQLDRAQEEIAGLRERQGALERARQEAEENWQRAGFIQTELQARLKTKTDELSGALFNLTELREQLDGKINQLQLELAQKQLLADSRSTEIGDLKAQLSHLAAQLTEAEATQQQGTDGQQENEQSRQEHQQEIAGLHEDYQTRLRDLESALAQARQTAENSSTENQQLAQRALQLESDLHERGDNLTAARAESVALQAHVNELTGERASSHAQAQAIEQARAHLDSELAALRQELQQKTSELTEQHGLGLAQKNALQELEGRLSEQNQQAASYSQEIQTAQTQAAALNQRVLDLELAAEQAQRAATEHVEHNKLDYDARLTALNAELEAAMAAQAAALENRLADQANLEQSQRQELQQSRWALAQQQAAVEDLVAAHRDQLQKVEAKLSQQRSGAKPRDDELEKSEAQANALKHRVEELEVALNHAEITALSRAEQIRQECSAQIDALNAALGQASAELAERSLAQANSDQSLRHEIDRLVREVEERNQILQNRNDELVRVKGDLDQFRDRFNQLQSSRTQAESATSGDVERMRSEFQAQLARLQKDLSQKESALEEHQGSVNGLEQQYRHELETLRRQLNEQKSANEQSIGASTINAAQLDRLTRLESTLNATTTDMAQMDGEPQQRHWRSRFVAKRRWKV